MSKIFRKNQFLLLIPVFLFSLTCMVGCKKEVKTETNSTETTTVVVDTTATEAADTMILDTADTRPTERGSQ